VGGFCLGILRLSCLSFQQCSVLIFIHAPSQLCRLDTNTLAKQIKDIPHRHDLSGVSLIKLVGYQYTLLTDMEKIIAYFVVTYVGHFPLYRSMLIVHISGVNCIPGGLSLCSHILYAVLISQQAHNAFRF
jgi:hypothetical protein